jgi:hypothetical protein
MLKAEMKRRAQAMGLKKFRKNSVLRPEAIQWLGDNPERNEESAKFLIKTEAMLYETLKAMEEEAKSNEKEKLMNGNWNGPRPWLRLYLCICHDEACHVLINRDNCMDHEELDARNHEDRPLTFEEVVANLYNDEEYVPCTEALPSLHSMFAQPIPLKLSTLPGGNITSDVFNSKLTEARSKVLQVS